MSLRNTNTSYGSVAKFFHWLIALLVLFMAVYGFTLPHIPKAYQATAYNIHKLTGLSILCLMLLNIFWALLNPKPLLPFDMPRWQRMAAHTVHSLLYIVIVAMPIAGWVGASAAGKPPHIGDCKIALPIAENESLSDAAFMTHNILAATIIVLVSIHTAAALYHYFIRKDNILQRMLPNW